MRDGGSCDGVQIQGWLVGFAAIFGRRAATPPLRQNFTLMPHMEETEKGGGCNAMLKPRVEYPDVKIPISLSKGPANDPPPFGEKKYCNFFGVEYPDVKISLLRKERQHVMDMGLSVGICVYSVAKLD